MPLIENGTRTWHVQSPAYVDSMSDFSFKSKGFHYCKLLSPARAMEYIYIDGLRAKLSYAALGNVSLKHIGDMI